MYEDSSRYIVESKNKFGKLIKLVIKYNPESNCLQSTSEISKRIREIFNLFDKSYFGLFIEMILKVPFDKNIYYKFKEFRIFDRLIKGQKDSEKKLKNLENISRNLETKENEEIQSLLVDIFRT